jgi:putative membrane protein
MQATEHFHDHEHHDHHHNNTQAQIKTVLLLGLGLYFVYNIASGNLTNYINVRFAWLSYIAAILFLLLAASSAWKLLHKGHGHKHGEHDDDHDDHEHHDHNHEELSWGILAIVAIPLVLGTLLPSRPLGANAMNGDFNMNAVSATTTITFNKNPLDRNVLDWIRLFNASDDMSEFNGQEADITGFVYRDSTFKDSQFLAARFTISCCVADAVAVGLPVEWNENIPSDTWVRVLGHFEMGDFRGEPKPILKPTSVEIVPQPEHPYLYP